MIKKEVKEEIKKEIKREIEVLLNRLIKADFPSLQSCDYSISIDKGCNYIAAVSMKRNKVTFWFDQKDLRKMSALAKTGVLVHELCHVERDLKKNPLYRLVTTALTFILPTIETAIETRDERETDELVIAKGYGKELLEFQKYHDERYKDYTKKDGLTRKEIGTRIKRSKNGNKPRLD